MKWYPLVKISILLRWKKKELANIASSFF